MVGTVPGLEVDVRIALADDSENAIQGVSITITGPAAGQGSFATVYPVRVDVDGVPFGVAAARISAIPANERFSERAAQYKRVLRFTRSASAADSLREGKVFERTGLIANYGLYYSSQPTTSGGLLEVTLMPFMSFSLEEALDGQRRSRVDPNGRKVAIPDWSQGVPDREALAIAIQAIDGVLQLATGNTVHRDIHHANTLMLADGTAVLADLSTTVDDRRGAMVDTLANARWQYNPPEQTLAMKSPSKLYRFTMAHNVFQLGVLLSKAFTGRYPYIDRPSSGVRLMPAQIYEAKVAEGPGAGGVNLDPRQASISSPTVRAFIIDCLQVDPRRRPDESKLRLVHDLLSSELRDLGGRVPPGSAPTLPAAAEPRYTDLEIWVRSAAARTARFEAGDLVRGRAPGLPWWLLAPVIAAVAGAALLATAPDVLQPRKWEWYGHVWLVGVLAGAAGVVLAWMTPRLVRPRGRSSAIHMHWIRSAVGGTVALVLMLAPPALVTLMEALSYRWLPQRAWQWELWSGLQLVSYLAVVLAMLTLALGVVLRAASGRSYRLGRGLAIAISVVLPVALISAGGSFVGQLLIDRSATADASGTPINCVDPIPMSAPSKNFCIPASPAWTPVTDADSYAAGMTGLASYGADFVAVRAQKFPCLRAYVWGGVQQDGFPLPSAGHDRDVFGVGDAMRSQNALLKGRYPAGSEIPRVRYADNTYRVYSTERFSETPGAPTASWLERYELFSELPDQSATTHSLTSLGGAWVVVQLAYRDCATAPDAMAALADPIAELLGSLQTHPDTCLNTSSMPSAGESPSVAAQERANQVCIPATVPGLQFRLGGDPGITVTRYTNFTAGDATEVAVYISGDTEDVPGEPSAPAEGQPADTAVDGLPGWFLNTTTDFTQTYRTFATATGSVRVAVIQWPRSEIEGRSADAQSQIAALIAGIELK